LSCLYIVTNLLYEKFDFTNILATANKLCLNGLRFILYLYLFVNNYLTTLGIVDFCISF